MMTTLIMPLAVLPSVLKHLTSSILPGINQPNKGKIQQVSCFNSHFPLQFKSIQIAILVANESTSKIASNPKFHRAWFPKVAQLPNLSTKTNPYSLGQARILWNPPNVTRSLFEMTLANWPPVARLLMENVTDARIYRMKERGDYLVVNYPRIVSRLVHPVFFIVF